MEKNKAVPILALLLGLALGVCAFLGVRNQRLRTELVMQHQREMADVVAAMADIEVNLAKLLLASGAPQSVSLLGETAVLSQHVESGLARLPLNAERTADAMKFAGQMGQYTRTLAEQISAGRMLTGTDEDQLTGMMTACRALGEQLADEGASIASGRRNKADVPNTPKEKNAIAYPSLIFDGPFSDGRASGRTRGLTGERITREQAREAAARYAGVTADRVEDSADSGGQFEAFGFAASTPSGRISVQVTGQGGHLLWMVPERAEFIPKLTRQDCLLRARVYLADQGFGDMAPCFVQEYDGMVVANFAAVQDGILLYPDQVKVQVSMESGAVVGAECSQYLMNHERREKLEPKVSREKAEEMLSSKLAVQEVQLCVIPKQQEERLCWGFEGTFSGSRYWVFIDAMTGEAAEILRVVETEDGETAV